MRLDMSRGELYQLRRSNMKKHLDYGDIKILSEMLMTEFPDITKSDLKDFANYLSQILNINSKRAFKADLARKIESVWPSLNKGDLDLTTEGITVHSNNEAQSIESIDDIDYEKELLNSEKWTRDLKIGKKEDSVIPNIAKDALKWRLLQKFADRTVEIEENTILELASGKYIADLIVTDKESRKQLLLVETGQFIGGLTRLIKQSHLRKLKKEANIDLGVLAIYDGTDLSLTWEDNS